MEKISEIEESYITNKDSISEDEPKESPQNNVIDISKISSFKKQMTMNSKRKSNIKNNDVRDLDS
jgi:hypothetical protein